HRLRQRAAVEAEVEIGPLCLGLGDPVGQRDAPLQVLGDGGRRLLQRGSKPEAWQRQLTTAWIRGHLELLAGGWWPHAPPPGQHLGERRDERVHERRFLTMMSSREIVPMRRARDNRSLPFALDRAAEQRVWAKLQLPLHWILGVRLDVEVPGKCDCSRGLAPV